MENGAQKPSKQSIEKTTKTNTAKSRKLSKMGPQREAFGRPKGGQRTKGCHPVAPGEPKWLQDHPQEPPGPSQASCLKDFLSILEWFFHDFSINFLIDFFMFSSASAEGRGTNRKNKQQTTNWMMVVMMMPMVLVCSLLMPVWGTVAGMPEASGYLIRFTTAYREQLL